MNSKQNTEKFTQNTQKRLVFRFRLRHERSATDLTNKLQANKRLFVTKELDKTVKQAELLDTKFVNLGPEETAESSFKGFC